MLSKNNRQEQFRKQEPKKQRFAIKKLTVGVASVLIGFTFMGLNASASADTTSTQSGTAETTTTEGSSPTDVQSKNVALPNNQQHSQNRSTTANNNDQNKSNDTQNQKATADEVESQGADTQTVSVTDLGQGTTLGLDEMKVTNESQPNLSAHGVKLPQRDNTGTNKNYYALNLKPDNLKADSTDTNLKFSMTELHKMYSGINMAANTKNYELRIKLDDRLAKYVDGIKLSGQGDAEASDASVPPITNMIKDEDGSWKLPLFYHDTMKNEQGQNVNGVIASAKSGRAWTNPNCIIQFNTQIENVVKGLQDSGVDLVNDPLVYGVYAYNTQTKKQIGNDGSTGFILSSESPFAKLPVDNGSKPVASNQPYFQSANAWAAYDKDTNSINIFYNPIKLGAWAWDGIAKGRGVAYANYQIDPALAPYIKNASYYYIPLDDASSPLNNDNGFNFNLGKKVADMPVGSAESENPGFSQFEIDNSYFGHTAKNPTFGIAGGDSGYKIYSRASFELINKPVEQILQELNDKGVNVKALQMGAYITGKDKSGNNNHLMSPNTLGLDSFNLLSQVPENVLHQPIYAPTSVKQGEGKDVTPTWPKNGVVNEYGAPTDATFTTIDGQTPKWVTIKPNASDGTIHIAPTTDVSVGMYNVPLKVTFAGDGSSSTVNVPVYVTDGNEQVTWGKNKDGKTTGAVVVTTDPAALKAHETSDNSMVLDAKGAVKSVTEYKIGADGKIDTTGTNVPVDGTKVSASWTTNPSTNVTTPSKSENIYGTVNVKFTPGSQPFTDGILGQDTDTPAEYTSTSNIKIPAAGAVGIKPETPVDVTVGIETSQDDFAKLVDHSNLDKAGINKYSYSWATEPKVGDTKGTIKITFTDKDTNGQPTYLNVVTPEGSLKVENATPDSDKYPVHYGGLNIVRPNDSSTATNSVDPTRTANTPAGAITGYKKSSSFTDPANVTVTVAPNGKVTVTATKDAKLGSFNVPVQVSYSDQSTATVYVPVSITGEDHNGNYYGDQTMTESVGRVPVLHKTTDSNTIDPNDASISKVQTVTYNYDWDHTNGNGRYHAYKIFKLNAAGTGYYLAEVGTQDDAGVNRRPNSNERYTEANSPLKFDNVNATWTWQTVGNNSFAPSTNVEAFGGNTGDTLYKNADGSVNKDEQTGSNDPTGLAGNSKWRMSYKINNTAFLRAAGLPSFYGTTGTWTNTYFDFLGATAKAGLTAHAGADVPTDTTGIEGYLNMGTLPTATPENGSLTSVTWAPGKEPGQNGKFVQGANRGTARLIFNSDPSSYLDIPVAIAVDANHVTPTDPGVNPDHPDDQHKDLFMSVTRKVFVNGVQNDSLTQTIRYARDKYTDKDGNVISYGNWQIGKSENGKWVYTPSAPATFAQETAPSETGKDTYVQYGDDVSTKTKTNVINAENVKSTTTNNYVTPQDGTPVYVTYQNTPATNVKVTYTFYDDTDKTTVGKPVVVTGDEGQTKSTGLVIPNGYKLAEGQTLPSTVTIPASDKNVTIHLVHSTKTVTPGEPGVTPDKPEYKDLFAKSTRTINVHNPETKQIDPHEETVEFGRTGVLDEATGEFLPGQFGAWKVYNNNALTNDTTGTWAAYTAPAFTGYTASPATVAEQTGVTANQNVTVDINYSSNGGQVTPPATTKASVTYKFHDDTDNKNVGTPVVVSGDEGQVLSTGLVIPNGYKLAAGQTLPTTVTIPGTDETVTIHLVHGSIEVTPSNVDPTNPANADMFANVKRTITTTDINGKTTSFDQPIQFGRSKTYDTVNNKVLSYGDWKVGTISNNKFTETDTPAQFGTYDVPQVDNWTSQVDGKDSKTVAAADVQFTGGAKNTVNYKPVDGATVRVSYRHSTKTVTPGEPGVNPSNKDYSDLFKEVTRTINVVNPVTGETQTQYQTVTFGRTGVKDEVTGKFIDGQFGPWEVYNTADNTLTDDTTGTWAEFDAPTIDGYIADPTKLDAQTVTADTPSTTATIKYTKTDANKYAPSYPEVVTTPGQTAKADVNYDGDKPAAGEATYKVTPGSNVPSWVSVDPSTGEITYTVPADASTQVINVPVTVTYADGTTDNTTAIAVVVAGKDHVDNPTGPKDVIKDPDKLPGGTTVTWKPGEQPDPNKKGDQPTHVIVTVPGHDPITIPTTVNYGNPTDAETYDPSYPEVVTTPGQTTTTDVKYNGDKPAAGDVTYKIADGSTVPSWVTVDPTTGTITAKVPTDATTQVITVPVTVTYKDGTTDTATATIVVVAGKDHVNNPTGPTDVIKDPDKLPDGTTVTWKPGEQPDPTKKGDQPTHVIVTVPGHDPIEIPTTVNYGNPTDADQYDPQGQPITTPEGKVPDAADGIKNKDQLPKDTEYTWADPDQVAKDVKTPGTHDEVINVKYPDGSVDQVTVQVTVPAPEGQDINTPQGVVPDPNKGIKNPGDLPDGTKITWADPEKVAQDVKTPGDHTETIAINYPDGTTGTVTITIHVTANGNGNAATGDQNNGNGNPAGNQNNGNGQVAGANTNVNTNNNNQTQAKKLPQTGNNSSEEAAVLGLGLASLASLFGLGGLKKRNTDK